MYRLIWLCDMQGSLFTRVSACMCVWCTVKYWSVYVCAYTCAQLYSNIHFVCVCVCVCVCVSEWHTMNPLIVTGNVAENSSIWRPLGRNEMILSRVCWLSIERSLSASSSTKIWHWLTLAIPFSMRSMSRPGVATITCTVRKYRRTGTQALGEWYLQLV